MFMDRLQSLTKYKGLLAMGGIRLNLRTLLEGKSFFHFIGLNTMAKHVSLAP